MPRWRASLGCWPCGDLETNSLSLHPPSQPEQHSRPPCVAGTVGTPQELEARLATMVNGAAHARQHPHPVTHLVGHWPFGPSPRSRGAGGWQGHLAGTSPGWLDGWEEHTQQPGKGGGALRGPMTAPRGPHPTPGTRVQLITLVSQPSFGPLAPPRPQNQLITMTAHAKMEGQPWVLALWGP